MGDVLLVLPEAGHLLAVAAAVDSPDSAQTKTRLSFIMGLVTAAGVVSGDIIHHQQW